MLDPVVGRGDFLLNVSVDVSSLALIRVLGQGRHVSGYLHRALAGRLRRPDHSGGQAHQLCAARGSTRPAQARQLRSRPPCSRTAPIPASCRTSSSRRSSTSPGIWINAGNPDNREDWAAARATAGVKAIHIAERDTQVSTIPKDRTNSVNTWSVDGFVSEGSQPAELGWGSHERSFPRDGKRHDFGSGAQST